MKISLPYTIENTTGEKLTFLRIVVTVGVEYLEAETETQPNAGPPMHVHYHQDECMTVSGKVGCQEWRSEKKYAGPGETLLFKAGTPHKFWNAGNDVLRCSGYASPAANLVYFLTQIFKSTNENGGRPGMYDVAFLLTRYKTGFGMLENPTVIQKVIFPVILFFGNLLGLNEKLADAPKPVWVRIDR